MSTSHVSTAVAHVIATYGITATNVINAYRFGGERLIGLADARLTTALDRGPSALNKGIRTRLANGQQRVSGYTVKGVHFGTDRAQSVVGVAVDLATKGVSLVAANAERLDRAANLNALATLNRVVMPVASVVGKVADRIEQASSELVRRAAGNAMPAKAVATRKLSETTRQAAAARKKITKRATKQVGQAVAEVATETSNAARRVARKATQAGAETSKVARRVARQAAETATDASNGARRVARKAEAAAQAA
jgi:hypothetical protein